MLKRNIASLIRKVSSREVGHPMDLGRTVSDSGESMEGVSVCGEEAVAETYQPVTDTAGQEKKKPKEFDFSMYVQSYCGIHYLSHESVVPVWYSCQVESTTYCPENSLPWLGLPRICHSGTTSTNY